MTKRGLMLLTALTCWGCAGTDRAAPQPPAPPAQARPATQAQPTPRTQPERPAPQLERGDEDFRSLSYSLSLQVDDPEAAYAWMRSKLREHGAEISSSNVSIDRGNISAKIDDEGFEALMTDLAQVEGMIASESTSTRDNRSTVANIQRKLEATREAAALLVAEAKHLEHGDEARALIRLHELNEAERVSLENQLRSYLQQSEFNDVRISLERQR